MQVVSEMMMIERVNQLINWGCEGKWGKYGALGTPESHGMMLEECYMCP